MTRRSSAGQFAKKQSRFRLNSEVKVNQFPGSAKEQTLDISFLDLSMLRLINGKLSLSVYGMKTLGDTIVVLFFSFHFILNHTVSFIVS